MKAVKIAPSIASADQSRLGWAVEIATQAGADLMDGDINKRNARQVVQAGATVLAVGRAIWAAEYPARVIAELRAVVSGALA